MQLRTPAHFLALYMIRQHAAQRFSQCLDIAIGNRPSAWPDCLTQATRFRAHHNASARDSLERHDAKRLRPTRWDDKNAVRIHQPSELSATNNADKFHPPAQTEFLNKFFIFCTTRPFTDDSKCRPRSRVTQASQRAKQQIQSFVAHKPPNEQQLSVALERTAMAVRKRARVAWLRRADETATDALPAEGAEPLEIAQGERRRRLVRELLERIPEEQAETMAMRFMLGWSLEEIAASTRVPLNTVRSRLRLAKEALRKRIAEDPVLAEELSGEGT